MIDYLLANASLLGFKWFSLIGLLLLLYGFTLFLVKEVYRMWWETRASLVQIKHYYKSTIEFTGRPARDVPADIKTPSKPRIVARKSSAHDEPLSSENVNRLAFMSTLPNYRDLVNEKDYSKFYEIPTKEKAN